MVALCHIVKISIMWLWSALGLHMSIIFCNQRGRAVVRSLTMDPFQYCLMTALSLNVIQNSNGIWIFVCLSQIIHPSLVPLEIPACFPKTVFDDRYWCWIRGIRRFCPRFAKFQIPSLSPKIDLLRRIFIIWIIYNPCLIIYNPVYRIIYNPVRKWARANRKLARRPPFLNRHNLGGLISPLFWLAPLLYKIRTGLYNLVRIIYNIIYNKDCIIYNLDQIIYNLGCIIYNPDQIIYNTIFMDYTYSSPDYI